MKVLVTGSAGFLGRVVVANLAKAGHEVIAGTRRPERITVPGVTKVLLDVTDKDGTRQAVLDSQCDAVVHLAALTRMRESADNPLAFYDVNTVGTLNVMHGVDELSRREREPVHVVFASTGAVYGSHPTVPLREGNPVLAENPYATTKVAAEELIRYHVQSGRSVATILRCSNIAGGHDDIYDDDGDHIIPRILRSIEHGTPIIVNGDGDTTRDYIHVADAADAIGRALFKRPVEGAITFNIGSGIETSVSAIIRAAEAATGRSATVQYQPAGAEARRVVMCIERATSRLGWEPTRSLVDQLMADAQYAADINDQRSIASRKSLPS